jgi:hypothetical protein
MTEGYVIVIKSSKMASVYCHGGIDDELVAVLESSDVEHMTALEILKKALLTVWPDWFDDTFKDDLSRMPVEVEPIDIPRGFLIVADCNTKTMNDLYGDELPTGWTHGRLTIVK